MLPCFSISLISREALNTENKVSHKFNFSQSIAVENHLSFHSVERKIKSIMYEKLKFLIFNEVLHIDVER